MSVVIWLQCPSAVALRLRVAGPAVPFVMMSAMLLADLT